MRILIDYCQLVHSTSSSELLEQSDGACSSEERIRHLLLQDSRIVRAVVINENPPSDNSKATVKLRASHRIRAKTPIPAPRKSRRVDFGGLARIRKAVRMDVDSRIRTAHCRPASTATPP